MLVADQTWERIRDQFSEEEKRILREAVTGETVCPKGLVVDVLKVPDSLMDKLMDAIDGRIKAHGKQS